MRIKRKWELIPLEQDLELAAFQDGSALERRPELDLSQN